jgi:hypothetical protein
MCLYWGVDTEVKPETLRYIETLHRAVVLPLSSVYYFTVVTVQYTTHLSQSSIGVENPPIIIKTCLTSDTQLILRQILSRYKPHP